MDNDGERKYKIGIDNAKVPLGTLEKELYLGKRRSRVIADAIIKSGRKIPHDVEIGLHYNYLKAMDRIKKDRADKKIATEIESHNSGSEVKKEIKW